MISVLIAVYAGDRAGWVREALDSIAGQTLPADEVVLVEDGPVTQEVRAVIDDYATRLPMRRVALETNQGLSAALQAGLSVCRHELVARADSDDICVPDRFQIQAEVMKAQPDLSALGGLVAEFDADAQRPYAVRPVAVGRDRVARTARWRSPLNHPTVMFRRTDVLAVGGYQGFVGIEDYHLWARLLVHGYHLDNVSRVLVRQRAGAALGRRRGGLGYARTELRLLRSFVDLGFISRGQAAAGLAVRLPVRLLPATLRSGFYRRALRRRIRAAD